MRYLSRRKMKGGTTSTLKKIAKFGRILKAGEAYPAPKRFLDTPRGIMVLHPTRGWKRA